MIVGEKNLPGQNTITDLKSVGDDYQLRANEIRVSDDLIAESLIDRRGYRFVDDNGEVRALDDSERPALKITRPSVMPVMAWLNEGEAFAEMGAHESLTRSILLLAGNIVVVGAKNLSPVQGQVFTIAPKIAHQLQGGKGGGLFITWHTQEIKQ